MRIGKLIALSSVLLLASPSVVLASAPRVRRGPTAPKLFKIRTPKPRVTAHMEPERATQIQTALIKSGYLTGEPSGAWDTASEAAMQKLQADNGWQTRLVPDARAIIKLGLGPNAPAVGDLATAPSEPTDIAPAAEPSNQPTPANR